MNSFVTRFTASKVLGGAHSSTVEDGEFSDASWGSAAGYGSLANGVPSFFVPDVPDVSLVDIFRSAFHSRRDTPANSIFEAAHR